MKNSDILKNIAHHISYEIEMLELSADKLKIGGLNQLEKNAYLEDFNLHVRNLLDFLYPLTNIKPDDVLAKHFFDKQEEFQSKLPEIENREFIRKRIAKEMAHLTYQRLEVTPEEKPWEFEKIRQAINGALKIFFESLTEEQRNWFYLKII